MTTSPGDTPEHTAQRPRPWQRHAARKQRPPVYVMDAPAETIVHIYRGGAVFVTVAENNGRIRQHPVSPTALTTAIANLPQTSGLLPKNTLATGQIGGETFTVIYVPPRAAKISCQSTAAGGLQLYPIQTPPLVCGLKGHDFRIFALNTPRYPTHDGQRLANAPWPNTYTNGSICWGNAKLPSMPNIDAFLSLYLEGSAFSPHLTRDRSKKYQDVAKLYSQLNAKTAYPLEDLVISDHTLDWLISGAAWNSRGGFAT
jgi:hypothetical protein